MGNSYRGLHGVRLILQRMPCGATVIIRALANVCFGFFLRNVCVCVGVMLAAPLWVWLTRADRFVVDSLSW